MTAQYAVGDTLVLTKGDDRLVREVEPGERVRFSDYARDRGDVLVSVGRLLDEGYVVTDVKPKPAPLPDVPGVYVNPEGGDYLLKADHRDVNPFGWYLIYGNELVDDAGVPRNLVKLVPESDLSEKLTEAKREARNELVNALLDHYPAGVDGYSAVTGAASWLVASFDITGASA